jgi:hypothetical protein
MPVRSSDVDTRRGVSGDVEDGPAETQSWGMVGPIARVQGFRVPRKRYTVAGILSVSVHGIIAFGALAWARQSPWLDPHPGVVDRPGNRVLEYVALAAPPPPPAGHRPDWATPRLGRRAPVRPEVAPRRERATGSGAGGPAKTSSDHAPAATRGSPNHESAVHAQEIAAGEVASTAGAGNAPIDYERPPERRRVTIGSGDPEGPEGRSPIPFSEHSDAIHVAELIGSPENACPVLRLPEHGHAARIVVSVGFDVDVSGLVDPATLHVVQSPTRQYGEREHYTHRYFVASSEKKDDAIRASQPTYDSVVTRDVRQHVAALRFRPALRDGRPIRSSVLISCQSA